MQYIIKFILNKIMKSKLKDFQKESFIKQLNVKYLVLSRDNNFYFDEYITCKICSNILYLPKECSSCELNFCENCINKYCNLHKTCINNCYSFNLRNSHNIVIHQLEKLNLNCMYCNGEFPYLKIEHHLQECKDRLELCLNIKCSFVGNVEEMKKHDCLYETMFCPMCKEEFLKVDKHNCNIVFVNKYTDICSKFKLLKDEIFEIEDEIRELRSFIMEDKSCLLSPLLEASSPSNMTD